MGLPRGCLFIVCIRVGVAQFGEQVLFQAFHLFGFSVVDMVVAEQVQAAVDHQVGPVRLQALALFGGLALDLGPDGAVRGRRPFVVDAENFVGLARWGQHVGLLRRDARDAHAAALDAPVHEIVGKLDVNADAREAAKLNAKDPFDVLIVGGGPAGAAAGVYAARKGIRTGIAAERFGGQVLDTMAIENLISVPHT